ncbi:hypothetical protein EC501_15675 [Lysinibacillus halotolerans]|uniref:Uncharacterized protein n=1 Tax=Lysinibacillus halotolerans TaxID=1368476 RepID=A0A3M8H532_9BACI|nr:hypothetical protein EC501_15675 [Lysinibacillus halotolerans]
MTTISGSNIRCSYCNHISL